MVKEIKRRNSFKRNISRRFSKERNISYGLKLKIWMADLKTTMGAFFLLFSIPFVIVFVPFESMFSSGFSDLDPTIEGKIIEVQGTSSYVNDVQVYEYTYSYTPTDGGNYEGIGYSTGQIFELNDPVQVIYKRNEQQISKSKELRLSSFPVGIGFMVLIFPLIGGVMFYLGTKKALNAIHILSVGEIAYGKLINKEATNTTVNKRRVYKLYFEYTAKDNKVYQTMTSTHLYDQLEDDDEEKLVYDPDDPENMVLLDSLPWAVRNYFDNE